MSFLRRVPLPLVGMLCGLLIAGSALTGGIIAGANAANVVDRSPAAQAPAGQAPGATSPPREAPRPALREWLRRHSVVGVVVDHSGSSLILQTRGQRVSATLMANTIIMKDRKRIRPTEIAPNDRLLIVGQRQPNGTVQARAILVNPRRPGAGQPAGFHDLRALLQHLAGAAGAS